MILKGGSGKDEIGFEIEFMEKLSITQRFRMMFDKSNLMRKLMKDEEGGESPEGQGRPEILNENKKGEKKTGVIVVVK